MYWELSSSNPINNNNNNNPINNNNTTVGGGVGGSGVRSLGFGSGSGSGFISPAAPPLSPLQLGLGKNHPHNSISFQSSSAGGGRMITNSSAPPPGPGGGCGNINNMPGIGTTNTNRNRNRNKAPAVATSNNPLPLLGLNPDVELAVDWSPEEQAILDDGLSKYADEPNIFKYIKISATLPDKTVRDVALRCRWMTKKENGKRRKPEDYYTGKKMKDRKEKPEPSSKSSTSLPPLNMGAYSLMMQHRSQNDRISCEGIGSATKHLLDENTQVFSHITANLATYKIQENVDLFGRTRRNILAILNDMRAMPGIMSQMPPLPVSINEELANIVLPQTYCSPTSIYPKPEWRC